MADLLVLTPSEDGAGAVLPALSLLSHRTRVVAPEPSAMLDAMDADVLVVDARNDLAEARNNCRLVQVTGVNVPLLLVLRDGGMSIVTSEWGADDVVLADAEHAIRVEHSEDGEPRPYLHVRRGLEALIDRKSFYRLVDLAVTREHEGEDWTGVISAGSFFPILRAAEL